jgi:site-specific recombinase XerD
MNKNEMAEWTIHWNQTTLRVYFQYLSEILNLNVLDRTKIKPIKVHEKNIWFYDEEEKSQILNSLNKWVWKREITQLRNKLLTYMLLYTWLRRSEIAKIKVKEIWESLQVVGKWWKRRVVFLRKELLEMVWEYISKRKQESEYLFPWYKDGEHIREKSIVNIFLKMSKEIWIHIHAHKFRHTFATNLLRLPWSNVYDVAKLMGHNSITTTQIYLWTNNEYLKKLQFWLKF